MCWRSTITITEEEARKELLLKVLDLKGDQLLAALEAVMGPDYGHNFSLAWHDEPSDYSKQGGL